DIGTVIRWIDGARLPAYRTPGGHRRVKRGDFENFVRSHNLPAPAAMARRRKSVLVVEDDEDFQRMIEGFLRLIRKDLAVHRADDGFLAGKMVESLKPDVVLLDIKMGPHSGEEVLAEIRRRWSRLCVIVVTGYPSLDSMRQTFRQDVFDYLAKPFSVEERRRSISASGRRTGCARSSGGTSGWRGRSAAGRSRSSPTSPA
ncbi:MAG: response regulator, partial [Acidobacteria bacterium]